MSHAGEDCSNVQVSGALWRWIYASDTGTELKTDRNLIKAASSFEQALFRNVQTFNPHDLVKV